MRHIQHMLVIVADFSQLVACLPLIIIECLLRQFVYCNKRRFCAIECVIECVILCYRLTVLVKHYIS